jgi:hypothetical protein
MGVKGILGIEIWYQPYADACSSLTRLIYACSHASTLSAIQIRTPTSCIWPSLSIPIRS